MVDLLPPPAEPPPAPAPALDDEDRARGVFDEEPTAARLCACGCGRTIPASRHPSAMYVDDDHKERAYRVRKNGGKAPASTVLPASRAKNESGYGAAVWSMLGYGVQLTGPAEIGGPVCNVMHLQAGDAGPRIERLTGRVTKVLPFLNTFKQSSQLATDLGALLGPPLLTAAIASGTLPRSFAEPLFIAIMKPLVNDALTRVQHQAEQLAQISDAERAAIDATRDLFDSIFGAGQDAASPEYSEASA